MTAAPARAATAVVRPTAAVVVAERDRTGPPGPTDAERSEAHPTSTHATTIGASANNPTSPSSSRIPTSRASPITTSASRAGAPAQPGLERILRHRPGRDQPPLQIVGHPRAGRESRPAQARVVAVRRGHGLQSAANSPGHKLRLTYATAVGDLREVVLGIIKRPWPIT